MLGMTDNRVAGDAPQAEASDKPTRATPTTNGPTDQRQQRAAEGMVDHRPSLRPLPHPLACSHAHSCSTTQVPTLARLRAPSGPGRPPAASTWILCSRPGFLPPVAYGVTVRLKGFLSCRGGSGFTVWPLGSRSLCGVCCDGRVTGSGSDPGSGTGGDLWLTGIL